MTSLCDIEAAAVCDEMATSNISLVRSSIPGGDLSCTEDCRDHRATMSPREPL